MERKKFEPAFNTLTTITTDRVLTQRELFGGLLRIRELYTLNTLVSKGRLEDFQNYMNTRNPRFEQEAGLNIKITFKSKNPAGVIEPGAKIELQVPKTSNNFANDNFLDQLNNMWGD